MLPAAAPYVLRNETGTPMAYWVDGGSMPPLIEVPPAPPISSLHTIPWASLPLPPDDPLASLPLPPDDPLDRFARHAFTQPPFSLPSHRF